ncbi:MAG: hypothetical protein ACLR0V_08755 [Roseburia hominis]
MRNWKNVTESSAKVKEDSNLKNQSSISFLLEFNKKKGAYDGGWDCERGV